MTPMMTVLMLLALAAFICAIVAANNKCPIWVSVIILCIIALVQCGLPLGK